MKSMNVSKDSVELNETIALLQELVKNKCVNPPGNEMKSIKTIEKFLNNKGIKCEVFESAPNRGNLVARIEGKDENHPGLIFGPSHVDVVPVTIPEKWTVEPFSAEIKDGYVWGRGTLDMLFMVATQVQAFCKLHHEGFKPKRDLILFIVADEECGGDYGAKWVIDKHPEMLNINKKKMYAVTESGGISIAQGKLIFINGEKGAIWKKLIFKGTPGHGSMPFSADNAVLKASRAALLLTNYCDKKMPVNAEYIGNLVKGLNMNFLVRLIITNKKFLPIALKLLNKKNQHMAKFIHSLSRMTISPNIVSGGTKTNIIAANAEVELDIRTLPGQDDDYVLFHLRKALGKLADETEIVDASTEEGIKSLGTESPVQSIFVDAMEKAIEHEIPNAKLVPLIAMGATDGRYLRGQYIDTYGFALYNPDMPMEHFVNLVHGIDERIDLKSLELSLNVYYNLVKEFL